MIRIVCAALSLVVVAMPHARAACKNPPPIFDCADWERRDGYLVARHNLTAGLLGMDADGYIGTHTIIDGVDYAAELKRQCDAKIK